MSLLFSYVGRKGTNRKNVEHLTCKREGCRVGEALIDVDGPGKEPLAVCVKFQVLLEFHAVTSSESPAWQGQGVPGVLGGLCQTLQGQPGQRKHQQQESQCCWKR